ncbi:MAG: SRPBCC domain-containing protein [Gemmatimonadota bacterium]
MSQDDNLIRTANRELTIARRFAAPAALVFEAWTNPDLLTRWMCPNDFSVVSAQIEPRVGGAWRVRMRSPSGEDMWHDGIYEEFTPPSRLVFTHIWSGAHPNPGLKTLVTIDFTDQGDSTTMTFHQALFTSQEDCDDHGRGWSEAFDHLAEALR